MGRKVHNKDDDKSERTLDLDRLYNSELKAEFLESEIENDRTKITVYYEFLKAKDEEERLQRDLFTFNDLEIERLLKSIGSSNVGSISKTLSIYNNYVKWAIDNGKTGEYESGRNNMLEFTISEKNLSKYVSNKQLAKKILTKEEFDDLLNLLVNPADRALLLCFYNFVQGKQLYEIRSMTKESIDVENQVLILQNLDEDEPRIQKVSKQLIDELIFTVKETQYYRNDGEDWIVGSGGSAPYRIFADTPYVFRPASSSGEEDTMLSSSAIATRIQTLREDTEYSYITPTSIRDTRIVHEVIDEMVDMGLYVPTVETYNRVAKRLKKEYGFNLSHMQKYTIRKKVEQLLEIDKI